MNVKNAIVFSLILLSIVGLGVGASAKIVPIGTKGTTIVYAKVPNTCTVIHTSKDPRLWFFYTPNPQPIYVYFVNSLKPHIRTAHAYVIPPGTYRIFSNYKIWGLPLVIANNANYGTKNIYSLKLEKTFGFAVAGMWWTYRVGRRVVFKCWMSVPANAIVIRPSKNKLYIEDPLLKKVVMHFSLEIPNPPGIDQGVVLPSSHYEAILIVNNTKITMKRNCITRQTYKKFIYTWSLSIPLDNTAHEIRIPKVIILETIGWPDSFSHEYVLKPDISLCISGGDLILAKEKNTFRGVNDTQEWLEAPNLFAVSEKGCLPALGKVSLVHPNIFDPFVDSLSVHSTAKFVAITSNGKLPLTIYSKYSILLDGKTIHGLNDITLFEGTHTIYLHVKGVSSKIIIQVLHPTVVNVSVPSRVVYGRVTGYWSAYYCNYHWRVLNVVSSKYVPSFIHNSQITVPCNFIYKGKAYAAAPKFTINICGCSLPIKIHPILPYLPFYSRSIRIFVLYPANPGPFNPNAGIEGVGYVTSKVKEGLYTIYIPSNVHERFHKYGQNCFFDFYRLDIPSLPYLQSGSNEVYLSILSDNGWFLGGCSVNVLAKPDYSASVHINYLHNPHSNFPYLTIKLKVPLVPGTIVSHHVPSPPTPVPLFPTKIYLNGLLIRSFPLTTAMWYPTWNSRVEFKENSVTKTFSIPLLPGVWNIQIRGPFVDYHEKITTPLVYSPIKDTNKLVRPLCSRGVPIAMSLWGVKGVFFVVGKTKYYVPIRSPGSYIAYLPIQCKNALIKVYVVPSTTACGNPTNANYLCATLVNAEPTNETIPPNAIEYACSHYSIVNGSAFLPGTVVPLLVHIFKGHTTLTTVKLVYANETYTPTGNFTEFSDPNTTQVVAPFAITTKCTSPVVALACNNNGCSIRYLRLNVEDPPQVKINPVEVRPGVFVEITKVEPIVWFDYFQGAWCGGVQVWFKAWTTNLDALANVEVTTPTHRVWHPYPSSSFKSSFIYTSYYVPLSHPFSDVVYVRIVAHDAYGNEATATAQCTLHFPANPFGQVTVTKKVKNTTPKNETIAIPHNSTTNTEVSTPQTPNNAGTGGGSNVTKTFIKLAITNKEDFVNPVPISNREAIVDYSVVAKDTSIQKIIAEIGNKLEVLYPSTNSNSLGEANSVTNPTTYSGFFLVNLNNPGNPIYVTVTAIATNGMSSTDCVTIIPSSVTATLNSSFMDSNDVVLSYSAKAYGTTLTKIDLYCDGNVIKEVNANGKTTYSNTAVVQLSNGQHTLSITAYGKDGSHATKSITVSVPQPVFGVPSASNKISSSTWTVYYIPSHHDYDYYFVKALGTYYLFAKCSVTTGTWKFQYPTPLRNVLPASLTPVFYGKLTSSGNLYDCRVLSANYVTSVPANIVKAIQNLNPEPYNT